MKRTASCRITTTLGSLSDQELVTTVCLFVRPALADPNEQVRTGAAEALEGIGEEAVPGLIAGGRSFGSRPTWHRPDTGSNRPWPGRLKPPAAL